MKQHGQQVRLSPIVHTTTERKCFGLYLFDGQSKRDMYATAKTIFLCVERAGLQISSGKIVDRVQHSRCSVYFTPLHESCSSVRGKQRLEHRQYFTGAHRTGIRDLEALEYVLLALYRTTSRVFTFCGKDKYAETQTVGQAGFTRACQRGVGDIVQQPPQ